MVNHQNYASRRNATKRNSE